MLPTQFKYIVNSASPLTPLQISGCVIFTTHFFVLFLLKLELNNLIILLIKIFIRGSRKWSMIYSYLSRSIYWNIIKNFIYTWDRYYRNSKTTGTKGTYVEVLNPSLFCLLLSSGEHWNYLLTTNNSQNKSQVQHNFFSSPTCAATSEKKWNLFEKTWFVQNKSSTRYFALLVCTLDFERKKYGTSTNIILNNKLLFCAFFDPAFEEWNISFLERKMRRKEPRKYGTSTNNTSTVLMLIIIRVLMSTCIKSKGNMAHPLTYQHSIHSNSIKAGTVI